MSRSWQVVPIAYYGALAVLLLLAVTGHTADVLPNELARHVSEDSEAIVLALVLSLWIQCARPRLQSSERQWPLTLLAAAVCLAVGVWLYNVDDVPGKVETLNESFLALAVLLPYVQLRRPLARLLVLGLPVAVLLLIGFGSATDLVVNLAEGLAMLVLVPIGVDIVDRALLDPAARTADILRWGWYAVLVVAPTVVALLHGQLGGALGHAVDYTARVQEAFVGILLVELYLAVGVGHGERRRQHRAEAAGPGERPAAPSGVAAIHPRG